MYKENFERKSGRHERKIGKLKGDWRGDSKEILGNVMRTLDQNGCKYIRKI